MNDLVLDVDSLAKVYVQGALQVEVLKSINLQVRKAEKHKLVKRPPQ